MAETVEMLSSDKLLAKSHEYGDPEIFSDEALVAAYGLLFQQRNHPSRNTEQIERIDVASNRLRFEATMRGIPCEVLEHATVDLELVAR